MSIKKVLTIAGSDTSGGAGIQADLKTFQERGVYGMNALTVIVTMDPRNRWAHKVFPVELNVIKEQIDTVINGIGVDALKTGMLPTAEIIEYVGSVLKDLKNPIVIDPVMVCKVTSGSTENLFPENVTAMKKYLLPYATVVTPNLFEAAQLAGIEKINKIEEAKEAAKKIYDLGAKNVVIKGRKFFAGDKSVDILYNGKNFEFFEVNVDGKEIKITKSISESIFGAKVDIIKSLQHLNYQEKSLVEYRNNLISDIISSILDINDNRFDVRMKGAIIDKYKKIDSYKALNEKDVQELKNVIAPLVTYREEEELPKRFDYQMYVIENAYLEKKSFLRAKNRVIETAEKLSEKGTIEKISKKKETITKIQKEEFWKNADLFQFEEVRKELRDLVILLDRITTKIYYTDFRDEIVDYGERETGENFKIVNKFEKYNKRVEEYLEKYKNDDVIQKLKNNIPLTMYDIKYLEKILWEDLGTKEEYEKTYGKIPLLKMVSKIIGMDRKAVEKEFSLFLSNENLNSDQINFVKHIVDYIVKNGSIDKKELKDFPEADKFGGLFQLFNNKRDVLTNIVKIIDKVNDRLDLVQ